MSRLYGLFADLSQRAVLVVGGGEVAERKILSLLQAGADIRVVAHELSDALSALKMQEKFQHLPGPFNAKLLDDVFLVVAATDDVAFNQELAVLAEQRYLLINVVDDAVLSTFHVPAIIDRGLLQIAVSTAGAAPALARKVRTDIEKQLDKSVGDLVNLTARFRDKVKQLIPTMKARSAFYEGLLNSPTAQHLKQNQLAAAEEAFVNALDNVAKPSSKQGHVTLVGAGPGDAGLLTLNGLRALQQADVILYDRLVSKEVLDLARRDAEFICVGKEAGGHSFSQDAINALILKCAQEGSHVVRLKGGDPFIFGRGGEELEYIEEYGIPFAIVPGITSASACASYAGIPLTHRDHSQSVRFVTAHCKRSIDTLDWALFAKERQTLAFYMGVGHLENIQAQLIRHGQSPATAFALIEQGTTQEQRVVTGQLANLAETARYHEVKSPAMLIIGDVAQLNKKLAWFGDKALEAEAYSPLKAVAS